MTLKAGVVKGDTTVEVGVSDRLSQPHSDTTTTICDCVLSAPWLLLLTLPA